MGTSPVGSGCTQPHDWDVGRLWASPLQPRRDSPKEPDWSRQEWPCCSCRSINSKHQLGAAVCPPSFHHCSIQHPTSHHYHSCPSLLASTRSLSSYSHQHRSLAVGTAIKSRTILLIAPSVIRHRILQALRHATRCDHRVFPSAASSDRSPFPRRTQSPHGLACPHNCPAPFAKE